MFRWTGNVSISQVVNRLTATNYRTMPSSTYSVLEYSRPRVSRGRMIESSCVCGDVFMNVWRCVKSSLYASTNHAYEKYAAFPEWFVYRQPGAPTHSHFVDAFHPPSHPFWVSTWWQIIIRNTSFRSTIITRLLNIRRIYSLKIEVRWLKIHLYMGIWLYRCSLVCSDYVRTMDQMQTAVAATTTPTTTITTIITREIASFTIYVFCTQKPESESEIEWARERVFVGHQGMKSFWYKTQRTIVGEKRTRFGGT